MWKDFYNSWMLNRWDSYWKMSWAVAALLILVIYWDISVLKVNVDLTYIAIKSSIILFLLLSGAWAIWKKSAKHFQTYVVILFFVYSFYGLAYLDMSYYFSFIEGFIFFGFILVLKPRHYIMMMLFGFSLFLWSLSMAKEPYYIIPGESIKPHVLVATSIIAFLAMLFFKNVTMYREQIMELNEKFALIGKQSSFLMHEIKNPLSRVVNRVEMLDKGDLVDDIRNDSNRISSIIQGIEILVSSPERFQETFETFNWSDVVKDIESEFRIVLTAQEINFIVMGLETKAHGNRYLLYQVIKNLITNALEAIPTQKTGAEIALLMKRVPSGIEIKVMNTLSKIHKNDYERIFEPLYSTKKNTKNKGLGLTFAKNIIEGHSGTIEVNSTDATTSFIIKLPESINV